VFELMLLSAVSWRQLYLAAVPLCVMLLSDTSLDSKLSLTGVGAMMTPSSLSPAWVYSNERRRFGDSKPFASTRVPRTAWNMSAATALGPMGGRPLWRGDFLSRVRGALKLLVAGKCTLLFSVSRLVF
jgi:hypothetical protein